MRPYNSNFWSNPSSRKIRPHPAIHIPITWTLGVDFCWSVPLRNPTSNSIFVCGPLHSSIGLVLNVRRIFPVELGSMRIGKRFVRVLWRGKSRAVAKFFVTGGTISSAEGTNLVGELGVSSPRKFSNLEALKRSFQHFSWNMSPKNRPRICKWKTIASHYNQNNWV